LAQQAAVKDDIIARVGRLQEEREYLERGRQFKKQFGKEARRLSGVVPSRQAK
jgi:hypothetical protein